MKQVSKMLFALIILLLGATGIGAAESALAINIAGSSPDGYQLTMTIPYETGMSSDFSDIRFYADSPRYEGGTELSYWIQDYTASDSMDVWVPIPAGTSVIYCGWGITGEVASESNGTAVMTWFEDWDTVDTATWYTSGTVTVTDSVVCVASGGSWVATKATKDIATYVLGAKVKTSDYTAQGFMSGFSTVTSPDPFASGSYQSMFRFSSGSSALGNIHQGTASTIVPFTTLLNNNNYYVYELRKSGTTNYITATDSSGTAESLSSSANSISTTSNYIWIRGHLADVCCDWMYTRIYDATPVTYTIGSVTTAPTANFTADPTNGSAPLTIQFTDASTGSPTSWYWDFGSGPTSTLRNPSHTFYINGTYTVNLTVTNIMGTDSTTDTVSVNGTTAPNNYSQYKDVLFTSNMTSWDFPENGVTFYTMLIPSWFFWSVILLIPYVGMYNRQGGVEIVAIIYLFTGGIIATVMPEQLAVYAKWFVIFGAVGVIYKMFIRE